MKRIKGSTIVTQYCLESMTVEEALDKIPKALVIKEIVWEVWDNAKFHKLYIPDVLRKLGVNYIREGTSRLNARGTLSDVSREVMQSVVKKIKSKYGLVGLTVKRLTLHTGKETATFVHSRKDIRFPNDKRKKLAVLALANKTSKAEEIILPYLSGKKIACQLIKADKQIVLCSEVK